MYFTPKIRPVIYLGSFLLLLVTGQQAESYVNPIPGNQGITSNVVPAPADSTIPDKVVQRIAKLYQRALDLQFSNPDSTLAYIMQSLSLAQQYNYQEGIADSYHRYSYYLINQNQADSALRYARKSLKIYQSLQDSIGIINASNDLALTNILQYRYNQALEIYLGILPIVYQNPELNFNRGRIFSNIGFIYSKLDRHEQARKYYQQAVEFARQINNDLAYSFYQGNLASAHRELGNLEKAITLYQNNLRVIEQLEMPDLGGIGLTYSGLADIQLQKGQLDEAMVNIDKALYNFEQIDNPRYLSNAYLTKGQIYQQQGNLAQGLESINIGLDYAKVADSFENQIQIYHTRSNIYEKLNKPQLALDNLKLANQARDSMESRFRKAELQEVNQEFNLKNSELEIVLLEQEKQLHMEQIKREQLYVKSLVGGSVLLSIILLLIFLKYRSEHSLKEKLENRNQQLEELNNEKNMYLRMAAHDLKSPLAAIAGLSELIMMDTNKDDEIYNYTENIQTVVGQMQELIQNLLDVDRIESENKKIRRQPIVLNTQVQEVIRNYKDKAGKKDIKLFLESSDYQITVLAERSALQSILNNLISNAIKYSPIHKSVWIKVAEENGSALVKIKDEGPGFSEEDKKEMFNKFKTLSAQPTGNESSNGLGLYIVDNLVKNLDGTITCESRQGEGATFSVRLPKTSMN